MKNKISLKDIAAEYPCYPDLANKFGVPESWEGSLLDILESDKVSSRDKIWVAVRFLPTDDVVCFARFCADQASRLVDVADYAATYADHAATYADHAAAYAAYAATYADHAAAYAAYAAAYAAYASYAAYAAAYAAARQEQVDFLVECLKSVEGVESDS